MHAGLEGLRTVKMAWWVEDWGEERNSWTVARPRPLLQPVNRMVPGKEDGEGGAIVKLYGVLRDDKR